MVVAYFKILARNFPSGSRKIILCPNWRFPDPKSRFEPVTPEFMPDASAFVYPFRWRRELDSLNDRESMADRRYIRYPARRIDFTLGPSCSIWSFVYTLGLVTNVIQARDWKSNLTSIICSTSRAISLQSYSRSSPKPNLDLRHKNTTLLQVDLREQWRAVSDEYVRN